MRFLPHGDGPHGVKTTSEGPRGVGGPKCPQALGKKNGKNRGYPFLTVFDNFLTKNGVNLDHIICDHVPPPVPLNSHLDPSEYIFCSPVPCLIEISSGGCRSKFGGTGGQRDHILCPAKVKPD